MSASEKLKALDGMLPLTAMTRLIPALPQIAAVVEAGQFALPVLQAYSINADEEGFQTAASQMHEAHEVLAAALAALEEALS